MSDGWYPDPAGGPGFRHWDGHQWSQETRPAPGGPPPGADPSPHRPRRSFGGPWLIGTLALLLVIAGFFGLRHLRGQGQVAEDTKSSTPTVSQWDETSTPSASPSTPPSSLDPSGGREVECEGLSGASDIQPEGRVASGPLSFELPQDWSRHSDGRMPMAKNGAGAGFHHSEESMGWMSSLNVAQLNMPDYPGTKGAATRIAQCLVTSDHYRSVTVQLTDLRESDISISGQRATRLDAMIRFNDTRLKSKASSMTVIVVDSQPTTMFYALVRSESEDTMDAASTAIDSLRVS